MNYFTAQNFVYWTIGFFATFVWTTLVCKRICVCANMTSKTGVNLGLMLLTFFLWPIELLFTFLIEMVFLLFPNWVITTLKESK